jgi:hypothetical protein
MLFLTFDTEKVATRIVQRADEDEERQLPVASPPLLFPTQ